MDHLDMLWTYYVEDLTDCHRLINTERCGWNLERDLWLSLQLEGEETLKYHCVCRPRAKKFNIVSNNHGHTQVRFSHFSLEIYFYGKFGQKNKRNKKTVSVSWNLIHRLIRICIMQLLRFIFPVFNWKYSFRENAVQKTKIVSLSWNLVPRLIRIFIIQWRYSLFLFYTRNTLFGQFWSKNQNCQFKLKFGT